MKKTIALVIILLLFGGIAAVRTHGSFQADKEAEKVLRSMGMGENLDAGVTVTQQKNGLLAVKDQGVYITHYMIMGPNTSAEPNISIDSNVDIQPSADNIAIVTHGWFDKASTWPTEMTEAIHSKVDPNQWLCVSYDWAGGALVANPLDAVKYANNIAGPRLAKTILQLNPHPKHVHLIGHSAGAWVIDSAANIIAEKNKSCVIHLTYLDAYIPRHGDLRQLKGLQKNQPGWAEQYYTRDITLEFTETDLKVAHNVDLSDIDPGINEHEFPYRWYLATITGHYQIFGEKNLTVLKTVDGLEYGFARSKEAALKNWEKSMTLKEGDKAIKLCEPKKNSKGK